ncbi:MAG: hypothetical protein ABIK37_07315 [candidate division WOR-3 bacterium]
MLLVSGLDVGGKVGAALPVGSLALSHTSTAVLGAQAAWSLDRVRLELGFDFVSLPGKQNSPYRLDLSQLALTCGYEFLHRPNWGFEARLGPGYAFGRRRSGSADEAGRAPFALAGIGIVQHEGRSRLGLGLDNYLYVESSGGSPALSDVIALRAGVAYAF